VELTQAARRGLKCVWQLAKVPEMTEMAMCAQSAGKNLHKRGLPIKEVLAPPMIMAPETVKAGAFICADVRGPGKLWPTKAEGRSPTHKFFHILLQCETDSLTVEKMLYDKKM